LDRTIIAFHQDDQGDWVADLACGHTQHVRHNPPWVERPWVTTAAGRQKRLGSAVECRQCEAEGRIGGGGGSACVSTRHLTRESADKRGGDT
jgi:hypothetical protein